MTENSNLFEIINSTFKNTSVNATLVSDNSSTNCIQEVQNVATLEQRQFAKYVLFYFILPIIALVGIIGNTLSLSLIRVNRNGYAFNTYLTALTVADILLLCLALARCIVIMVARYPDTLYPKLEIYGEYYLSLVFGIWLQRVSSTLISVIAIERFVAVAFPFKVRTFGLETHPVRTVVCTIIGTFVIQIPTFVLLEVKEQTVAGTNETMYTVYLRQPSEAAEMARHIYLIIIAVVNMFIPLLIVAASTIAIVICLRLRLSPRRVSRAESKDLSYRDTMTLTLIALSVMFTLCYIPAIVIYLLPSINAEFYKQHIYLILIAVDANVACLCLNSASDFLIYFLASGNFRTLFVNRYCPCSRLTQSSTSRTDEQMAQFSSSNIFSENSSRSQDTSIENLSDFAGL